MSNARISAPPIVTEGRHARFVNTFEQIDYNGDFAALRPMRKGWALIEIAPGDDLSTAIGGTGRGHSSDGHRSDAGRHAIDALCRGGRLQNRRGQPRIRPRRAAGILLVRSIQSA
jgi:hypothetical protein